MALHAKMKIEGIDTLFTVVECEYSMVQRVDPNNGLPLVGLNASQILVTIVTPAKGRPLYVWMMEESCYLNGVIRLVNSARTNSQSVRHVWFENGKCIGLYEYFNNQNSLMMTTRLTIQPAKMGFVDGPNLEASNIGYDFRSRKRTYEKPQRDIENQIINKFDMDWRAERINDDAASIVNDPYYDQF